jgi:isoleucyl-tRNA synthetase
LGIAEQGPKARDQKIELPKLEEEILKYWEENRIFEKSVEKDAPNGDYVFYDGPPFATAMPAGSPLPICGALTATPPR